MSPTAGVSTIAPCCSAPASGLKVTAWVVGVDRRDLGRVDDEHREAVDSAPPGAFGVVGVPGVDVAVHRGGDDLELAVAVEVGEHRRADEAVLGAVELCRWRTLTNGVSGLPE